MKPIISFIAILCCILLGSCKSKDEPKDEEKIHRTVLVYMVTDNTLGQYKYDKYDLNEMVAAAQADGLNGGRLLVYYNRYETGFGEYPQLLEITKEGPVVIKEYPNDFSIYSVDPNRIAEVMTDMKKLAPAKDYGLVMWSHANGWLESSDDYRSRSFGDDRGRHITIPGLAKALEGNYFSFIYFDCCLMGTVEVAYELRHLTPVIVASPTELPVYGMPYDKNVPCFFVNGQPQMIQAATNTYNSYVGTEDPYCQMVVINTDGLDQLAQASRDVFKTVTAYPDDAYGIQRYSIDAHCWNYDMRQYFEMIGGDLYPAWQQAFKSTIAYAVSTPLGIWNLKINDYSGLGSFIILSESDKTYRGYNNCAWYKDVVSASPLYGN
ncbi:MAG: clostripain-related cysteine peptidase [Duncaniella sp.]|nr:clostripain-related cysteine peptidase [Muribaculum sp.]MCM1255915.1 clostripain-related cysteine peptidase [Duncaniella sp.]